MSSVSFDSRSLIIDQKRKFIISGEIHYARVPRSEWSRLLDTTKASGVNCVAAYIFWNVHEPERDVYNFSGQADLGAFLTLCREKGLEVILRMGPYCCAEWNYGGYPLWLRDEPGITFRTWNAPYIDRVSRYFRMLMAVIVPHLKTRGGNVIIVQVENEYNNVAKRYGADGQKHVSWMVNYVKSLGLDVPALTCYGGVPEALEAVNGFSVHEQAAELREQRPEMPLLWTENWPGWYDTFGFEHHVRQGGEIGYEILRFLAEGGSGFNYYMWHGGTNFGRDAMFLQTPSYDFGAPLTEYGEPTRKSRLLASLHHALRQSEEALLSGDMTRRALDAEGKTFTVTWKGKKGSCLASINTHTVAKRIEVAPGMKSLKHPPSSACFWLRKGKTWKPAWKSWSDSTPEGHPSLAPWKTAGTALPWISRQEPLPAERRDGMTFAQPVEQLQLTQDQTDYCWYAATFQAKRAGKAKLRITFGGDYFHVFVNGRFATRTVGPLKENRGPNVPEGEAKIIFATPLEELEAKNGRIGFRHDFEITLRKGKNRLEILACALGLIKGDWQITLPMNFERKGIWAPVLIDGRKFGPWELYPGLLGERLDLPGGSLDDLDPSDWNKPAKGLPLSWHLQTIQISKKQLDDDLVWAIDAKRLGKGMLWINGHCLGRYWQLPGNGHGPDAVWHPSTVTTTGHGEPPQRFYRIPREWLLEENRLIVFSETGECPGRNVLVSRRFEK